MKPTIIKVMIVMLMLLASCHAITGYEPGYQRVSFERWISKTFERIGVELQLPEESRVDYHSHDVLRILLHTYFPKSMLVEYTTTYYISVNKFTPDQYLHPTYNQENITSPYFYKKTEYINKKELNGRLHTDSVHLLIKHQKDSMGNIYVIKVSIYPWPDNQVNIQEDINYGYKIINSLRIK